MAWLRQLWAALRLLLVMTVLLGIGYPLVILLVAQALPAQAHGSLVIDATGRIVGSSQLGQKIDGPQWFQPRPSMSDYAGTTSGGSNLSPVSQAQATAVEQRRAALVAANPNAVGAIPDDALTASASGLDPDISVAYARWQAPRVATARQLSIDEVNRLIDQATTRAPLGYLGQDAVNVVKLNALLATR
ncbi:MAG: potassium-transporting ATPase subunit KdpC [Propionibacteriales bacterium]|jgi:K+-transporting ATPase ATPase C chain|nr:potassium-transporting ATPase subunit KdpC [Propionibacteriales bacterium]